MLTLADVAPVWPTLLTPTFQSVKKYEHFLSQILTALLLLEGWKAFKDNFVGQWIKLECKTEEKGKGENAQV